MSVSIFGTRPPKTLNLDCAFSRHLFGDQGGNELRARSSWESVTSSEKIDAPILLEMERPYWLQTYAFEGTYQVRIAYSLFVIRLSVVR